MHISQGLNSTTDLESTSSLGDDCAFRFLNGLDSCECSLPWVLTLTAARLILHAGRLLDGGLPLSQHTLTGLFTALGAERVVR